MSATERRQSLWEILCQRRQDTVDNLAAEFQVSRRTMLYDIEALTLSYPIETMRGRYGGGVKVSDWYHPTRRMLCPEQVALLKKMATSMSGSDLVTLNSIISQFAP